MRLIECVPNFSEGRDKEKINEIVAAISAGGDVKVLDVDPGEATNRTVVTFVGEPEAVVEAALRGMKRASELIDMTRHHGAHPRMGATDVMPLVPVSGVTLEECAQLARELAKRASEELGIPCYCYEAAAYSAERKNLAVCREGEYEGLPARMGDAAKGPDFGNRPWDEAVAKTGCTAVGARDFLIAVNFNLNTTSTRRANAVAFDVREKGRPLREDGKPNGKPVKDSEGNVIMLPGTLKGTKAIGWYIDEYGIAQVSMNITDIGKTSLHRAFDEVCAKAAARGLRVTGTEIVGLIPKRALLDAGKHYLRLQQRSLGIPEEEIIKIAVKSMGLDDLKPFLPEEKIIEYMVEPQKGKGSLTELTCRGFADETSSESPAPGGGSVSAYVGSLGAALAGMVANLSAHKAGWDDKWESFSDVAVKARSLQERLIRLVDEDTDAFNGIMAVFSMPKKTEEEKRTRAKALEAATLKATEVPLETMKAAVEALPLAKEMVENGNPNSVTDAGVAALCARAAVLGAWLNVRVNVAGLKDREKATEILQEAQAVAAEAIAEENNIISLVNEKLG